MKNRLILLLFILLGQLVLAQDVIVKKDGSKLDAKVIEIHEDEIHYKKFNNQDGPTYILSKSLITEIRYESGDVEKYAAIDNAKKQPKEPKQNDQITVRSNQFYYQGRQISKKKVKELFAQYHAQEAIEMWNKSNMNQGFSYAANIISYPVVILSYINPLGLILDPAVAGLLALGGYVVSAGLQVVYFVLRSVYHDQQLEAVELYNDKVKLLQESSDDDYY